MEQVLYIEIFLLVVVGSVSHLLHDPISDADTGSYVDFGNYSDWANPRYFRARGCTGFAAESMTTTKEISQYEPPFHR